MGNSFRQLLEFLLQIVRLLVQRFLKPFWIIFILVIILIAKNLPFFIKTSNKFGIPEYSLIKDYFSIILSWPVIILVIALIFIFRFSSSIKIFLENSRLSKAGPIEVAQHQEPITPEARPSSNTNDADPNLLFSYLNIILVFNTKVALLWFYSQPNHSATKDFFMSSYQMPPIIINQSLEKEAIFNALLTNELIKIFQNAFTVTERGERFLKFLNFILS